MQERELKIPGGSLSYVVNGNGAEITGYQGMGSEVTIPEQLGSIPVTSIGKKAFLSKKHLRRLALPKTVEQIGDWAFACCSGLERVSLAGRSVRFGKAVFLDCESLQQIVGEDGRIPGELLAAAVRAMDAYYLLDLTEAGSAEWFQKWDARLSSVLHADDLEGYSKQVLCGEEDYGSTDMDAYTSGRRKYKVRLALLRCLFSRELTEGFRLELEDYLRAHTKGNVSQETWQVVLEEHGNHREYYRLFAELGCLNKENLDGILSDIGETYPEMKAFFLRYGEENWGERNFLSDLEL